MILWLAPMDGITDLPYRIITKKIFDKYNTNPENKLRLWTEFMTSDWYVVNPHKVIKHIIHTEFETPLILQIFGWKKEKLLATALDIEKKFWFSKNWELKIAGIELNIWCPSNTVMKNWWWSALLKNKSETLDIIKTLSKNLKVPFSIKSRAWLNEEDKKAQLEFLVKASKYCHTISVHARTLKELYTGEWDRNFIYKLKKEIQKNWNNCKVIWNWAIKNYQDILKHTTNKSYNNFDFSENTEYIKSNSLISNWTYLPYNPELKDRAKELRKNMTNSEKSIRYKYFKNINQTVLRQKPIDNYIVDFYIPSESLVIEIDWNIHDNNESKWYDQTRTNILMWYWLKVIKFTNHQINNDISSVIKIIDEEINPSIQNHPSLPSLAKRVLDVNTTSNKQKLIRPSLLKKVSVSSVDGWFWNRSKTTNLDWIMIWQAAIWNPRIFTNYKPTNQEKFETILEHFELMAKREIFMDKLELKDLETDKIHPKLEEVESINIDENYDKIYYTPLLFRKYLHQYLKWIVWWKELKELCNKTLDFKENIAHIKWFFEKRN